MLLHRLLTKAFLNATASLSTLAKAFLNYRSRFVMQVLLIMTNGDCYKI